MSSLNKSLLIPLIVFILLVITLGVGFSLKDPHILPSELIDRPFPDFKAAELYLRSKGGWSPTNTVEEREVGSEEEEDRSAVEEIMTRLGKNTPDEHEDNG